MQIKNKFKSYLYTLIRREVFCGYARLVFKSIQAKFKIVLAVGCLLKFSVLYAQTPSVDAFKYHLNNTDPIKSLRFTTIDCHTGNQNHYYAEIGTNGFFLREYDLNEDPTTPISIENRPKNSNFYGENNDCFWEIDSGLEINKSYKSNSVANVCTLGVKTSKNIINTLRNFGISSFTAKRGTIKWNETNSTLFTFHIADGVTVKRLSDQATLTNLPGSIVIENGVIQKMNAFNKVIYYEYSTNSNVPFGIPIKIILGKNASQCSEIFLIEELQYGSVGGFDKAFDPESKFLSTNMATIVVLSNGKRSVLYNSSQKFTPTNHNSEDFHIEKPQIRFFVVGISTGLAVIFFLLYRFSEKSS
jgi:hypothetical protein